VTLVTEDVPEDGGCAVEFERFDADAARTLGESVAWGSRRGHPGEITLDIGHEDGYAQIREGLGKDLKRDGLARPGRAGDQAMTVGHPGLDRHRMIRCADQQGDGVHDRVSNGVRPVFYPAETQHR